MKYLVLNNGVPVTLDNDWYEVLHNYGWVFQPTRHSDRIYAKRHLTTKETGRCIVWLHKFVAGFPIDGGCFNRHHGFSVKFIDGDPKNMVRSNIEILSPCRKFKYPCFGTAGRSGFVGVKWNAYYGMWEAHLKDLTIKFCNTEIGAALAYNFKAKEILGENAEINIFDFMSPSLQWFKPRKA